MDQNSGIKTPKLPKMLGELAHSNQFLKIFSISSLGLALLSLLMLFVFMTRDPVILTLTPDAKILERAGMPDAKEEIQVAVYRYLEKRYNWDPKNVRQNLAEAEAFVLPSSLKSYQKAIEDVARFSTEKLVSQRVYPGNMEVNLAKKSIAISGDRVTSIQGLKAAGDLRLEISFESGPRTEVNPWGIYITKEKEQ